MTYLRTNNRYEKRRFKVIVLPVALLLIFIVCMQFFMPHFLPAVFTSVAAPFWRAEFSIESGSLRSPQTLLNENERLKIELEALRLQSEATGATEIENRELRSLLGREEEVVDDVIVIDPLATSTSSTTPAKTKSEPAFKIGTRTLAAVLKRPPFAPYDEIIIDGGEELGFVEGDKVYGSGSVLIGRVSDVLGSTAKVLLLSSPGQRYEVLIGEGRVPAYAVGIGGGQYSAELPRVADIKEGDVVISSAINDKPFGIITTVLADPAQAFKTVLFAPPINVYQLRWVLVEKTI